MVLFYLLFEDTIDAVKIKELLWNIKDNNGIIRGPGIRDFWS